MSQRIPADVYLCINGDEPLFGDGGDGAGDPQDPETFFRRKPDDKKFTSLVEAVDDSNIKVVTDQAGNALFLSPQPDSPPQGEHPI